jgi:hypothetical protein
LLDNSPVGILVRLISDAAAPLAGLSAATLAYSAAAMLPVWLPIALGGRGKRSILPEPSFEERMRISARLRGLSATDLYSNRRDLQSNKNGLVKRSSKPRPFIGYGPFTESLRKISRKLTPSQKAFFD